MTAIERRLQERYSLDILVQISSEPGKLEQGISGMASAANISSGGAFITTSNTLPLASRIYLKFLVDFEQLKKLRFILSYDSLKQFNDKKIWVTATGIVIRIEEDGMGIIFDEDYQLTPMDGEAHDAP